MKKFTIQLLKCFPLLPLSAEISACPERCWSDLLSPCSEGTVTKILLISYAFLFFFFFFLSLSSKSYMWHFTTVWIINISWHFRNSIWKKKKLILLVLWEMEKYTLLQSFSKASRSSSGSVDQWISKLWIGSNFKCAMNQCFNFCI